MNDHFILLLMGESGSGKTTIANILEQRYGLPQVKSYTTRPKRYSSENNHTFITSEEFKRMNNWVAYTHFDGHDYGTTREQVESCSVYVIDPDGVEYFKSHYTGTRYPVVIYLQVDEQERLRRMLQRGDGVKAAMDRLENDHIKFSNAKSVADYVIENTDIEQAVSTILSFVHRNNKTN